MAIGIQARGNPPAEPGRTIVRGENSARLLTAGSQRKRVDQSWTAPGMAGWDPAAPHGPINPGPYWHPF